MKKLRGILLFSLLNFFAYSQNPLSVVLNKSDIYCFLGSASIGISGGVPPYKYAWSTGDTVQLTLNNLENATYSVHVKDDAQGDTTVTFAIERHECEVGIANHFTPNDDGFNDTWSITHLVFYPEFELYVFNRSGQTVHHQSGQYIPWDGRSFGIKVPDATYYYIFYFDKNVKSRFLKGDVSILR